MRQKERPKERWEGSENKKLVKVGEYGEERKETETERK